MPFFFRLAKQVAREAAKQNNVQQVPSKVSPKEKDSSSPTTRSDNPPHVSPRVAGFKDRTWYEVLLEWNLSLIEKPFKYQRIGLNSWTTMEEALQDISWFVRMMNNVSCDKATVSKIQVVRIVGIYEKNAFKDWSDDPYNRYDSKELKKHIAEAIALSKKSNSKVKKPISYVKSKPSDLKVR